MDRELYIWVGIVGLMLMTVLTRSGLIIWPRQIVLPIRLQRALRYAPMAAIAAVIVPSVLFQAGGVVDWIHPKPIAVLAALMAWWATRHMAVCMAGGLAVYVIAKLALG